MRHITLLIAAVMLALAAPAVADRGGTPNGGAGNGNRYAPTLVASPNVVEVGQAFDVSGCGYDTEYGNVIVGFTGGSWGSPLDADGCFTITGIPAISGDTLDPGTYPVTAYQYVHNGRLRATGETTVTVVS